MDPALLLEWAKLGRAFVLAISTFAGAGLTIFSLLEWDRRHTLRRIERALTILEAAVAGSRHDDVQTSQAYGALEFLEQHAAEKWPFEQFRQALQNTASRDREARWQTLDASFKAIKMVLASL